MQPSGPSKSTASVGHGSAWISQRPNRDLLLISCMPLYRGMIETHDVGGGRLLVSPETACHHIRMRGMKCRCGRVVNHTTCQSVGLQFFWWYPGAALVIFCCLLKHCPWWGFKSRRMMSGTVAEGNGSVMLRLESWARWRRFDGPLISRRRPA